MKAIVYCYYFLIIIHGFKESPDDRGAQTVAGSLEPSNTSGIALRVHLRDVRVVNLGEEARNYTCYLIGFNMASALSFDLHIISW
jgi:hypothetical protein